MSLGTNNDGITFVLTHGKHRCWLDKQRQKDGYPIAAGYMVGMKEDGKLCAPEEPLSVNMACGIIAGKAGEVFKPEETQWLYVPKHFPEKLKAKASRRNGQGISAGDINDKSVTTARVPATADR